MEALLDFFDPTEEVDQPSASPNAKIQQDSLPQSLPPEVEVGNVEYKLKLLNPTASRFEHLVTQMKWRLREGQGEAIYEIGVADSGMLTGLTESEMEDSIDTLRKMADRLGAALTILRQSEIPEGSNHRERKLVSEVLIRKVPDDQQFLDLRLAVVGPMDAGKSTLLGVLTQGELDNGRGRARLNLFRHLHEIQSGRTSSISHEILGFDSKGETVDYSKCVSAEEICENSSKLITFIDLAGHQKYMKTTIFGLTAHHPDFSMLVVGANSGVVGTACEHLGFSVALKVPIFVVVTKADLCTHQQVENTVQQLEKILKSAGCSLVPLRVNCASDACNAAQQFAKNAETRVAPIFVTSCVTGDNLDLICKFLNAVPPLYNRLKQPSEEQLLPEFRVDEIFNVPKAGTVLGGKLRRGVIREGDPIMVGPKEDGGFVETRVATVRRNRIPCGMVRAGQAATVTLDHVERTDVRKGTVLISPQLKLDDKFNSCWGFEAEIYMLYSTGSKVKPGFQGTVYVASAMQNADICEIKDSESLAAGQKGLVRFQFLRHPEFLKLESRVLFREGRTKGIGQITKLIPEKEARDEHSSSPQRRKPSR